MHRFVWTFGLSLIFLAGCQCWQKKKDCCTAPPTGGVPQPIPPGAVPGPPPGAPAPAFPTTPPPGAIPVTPPPGARSYYGSAPVDNPWQPANPNVRLAPPETQAPDGVRPAVSLEKPATPILPVGIAGFAQVLPRVSSGQKPDIDGLDWLRNTGYQAVLHIRGTGEDDVADHRQVEKRGMKYLALPVSANTLNRQTVDEFSRAVTSTTEQPLFVYDREGLLVGSMWYLHFRLTDRLGDEEARLKASRLGLKEDAAEFKTMWVAMQKLLSEQ